MRILLILSVLSSLNEAKFDIFFIFIMDLCMGFQKTCYIALAEIFCYYHSDHTHFLTPAESFCFQLMQKLVQFNVKYC